MKVLYLILKQTEKIDELMEGLKALNIRHGTIVDARSMTRGLQPWSDDSIIIGGMIRRMTNYKFNEECKIIMLVLDNEQVEQVKQLYREVIDINQSGTAILFTMPIDYAEGLGD